MPRWPQSPPAIRQRGPAFLQNAIVTLPRSLGRSSTRFRHGKRQVALEPDRHLMRCRPTVDKLSHASHWARPSPRICGGARVAARGVRQQHRSSKGISWLIHPHAHPPRVPPSPCWPSSWQPPAHGRNRQAIQRGRRCRPSLRHRRPALRPGPGSRTSAVPTAESWWAMRRRPEHGRRVPGHRAAARRAGCRRKTKARRPGMGGHSPTRVRQIHGPCRPHAEAA